MRVAICDPSIESLELIENYLKESSYVSEIELFSEIKYLFDEMKKGLYYDLIFLEIDWHIKKIGFDYAKELQKIGPYTKIVYINECAGEYIEEIFLNASNLSGFILKPVSKEKLEKNVEKIKTQKMNMEDKLIFRYRGNILAIPFENLFCIESQLHKVNIILSDEVYQCNEKLEQIAERLNSDFLRCHQSYIVNMNHIRIFSRSDIMLSNGKQVPVSKMRYKHSKEIFSNYLSVKET